MRKCVERRIPPAALQDTRDRWWSDVKASAEFLDLVFEEFFDRLDLPNLMHKTDYHRLASLVLAENIHNDVHEILDQLCEVAKRARPGGEEP